VQKLNKFFLT